MHPPVPCIVQCPELASSCHASIQYWFIFMALLLYCVSREGITMSMVMVSVAPCVECVEGMCGPRELGVAQ